MPEGVRMLKPGEKPARGVVVIKAGKATRATISPRDETPEQRMRAALEALAKALENGDGDYRPARFFLESRGEYSGDLSDLYLLERVALKALGK